MEKSIERGHAELIEVVAAELVTNAKVADSTAGRLSTTRDIVAVGRGGWEEA